MIVEILVIFALKSYYYAGLENNLTNQITLSSNFYNTYFSWENVKSNVINDLDLFWENTKAQVQIIDKNGDILMDSSATNLKKIHINNQINDILQGNKKLVKERQFINGEPVMVMMTPLYYNENVDGILRFIASTKKLDETIFRLSKYSMLIGFLVIVFSSIVSLFIANTVVKPLKLISNGAENMAKGDFSTKIPNFNDYEVNKLAETLNYMSEEILKNEKLKNEFIASVSHELRTPLTSIKGWSIVLKSSDFRDQDEIQEGLDIIEKEVDRLTYLVEDLLDFSKLLSGKISLQKEKTDIGILVKEICKQIEPKIKNENLDLYVNIEENIPMVVIDRNRIKQVLINILDNSIKFTYSLGKIYVDLNKDDKNIIITIRDTGIGISAEDLIKVKEKFYKGKTSKSSNGIGLSVSDEIIQMHKGTLNIYSKINEGTEVKITLPITV